MRILKFALCLIPLAPAAHAAGLSKPNYGRFAFAHQISHNHYDGPDQCETDGGKWDAAHAKCVSDVTDVVEVTEMGGRMELEVDTIVDNGHGCGFNSESAHRAGPHAVVGFAQVDVLKDGNPNSVKEVCVVNVEFSPDGNRARTRANEACRTLCGENASLDIEDAVRADRRR